jgi:hypothetical protein
MRTLFLWVRQDNILILRRTPLWSSEQLAVRTLSVLICHSLAIQAQHIFEDDKGVLLPNLPGAKSPITLLAVNDRVTGKSTFSFGGKEIPPVKRDSIPFPRVTCFLDCDMGAIPRQSLVLRVFRTFLLFTETKRATLSPFSSIVGPSVGVGTFAGSLTG